MIILGDIASPTRGYSEILQNFFFEQKDVFKDTVICNLEGLISEDHTVDQVTPLLYNHPSIIDALKAGGVKICALANNHTLDLPLYFDSSIDLLKENGINSVGASSVNNELGDCIIFEEQGHKVFLFNLCWDFLLYHQDNPCKGIFVETMKEKKLLERINNIRSKDKKSKIVVYFHWSLDLEILPFPSYRKFSKELIDAGVQLVVGCHSHCIQGGEYYKEGLIVYGIGNFFIPWDTYVNGKMGYPDFSKNEIGIEWDLKSNKFHLHWFEIDGVNVKTKLIYKGKSDITDSNFSSYLFPFTLDEKEYIHYFKKNRRKRFLMPVFKNYSGLQHDFELFFLKSRAMFARKLAKYNLRKWNN